MIRITIYVAICAATIANAYAQSSVTLYGVVDAGIEVARTGGNMVASMQSGPVSPSRWGLTGSEDLGGGLSAIFKLEDGFNINNGAISGNGALFNREAWVGLNGRFGKIQLGNNYTPLFLAYVTYSQGLLNTLAWGNATNNFAFVPPARTANSVRYEYSLWDTGLTLRGLYARGANGAAGVPSTLGDTLSAAIAYKKSAFSFDAVYLQQKYAAGLPASLNANSSVSNGRYYLVGSSYDFGMIKPAFLFEAHRNAGGIAANNSATYASPDHDLYEVSVLIRYPYYFGGLLLSFGQYRMSENSAGNALSYGARYDYQLSKRTGVYVGVGYVKNNSRATFSINNASTPGVAVPTGKSVVAAVFGVMHRF